jgi:hypothetical protein
MRLPACISVISVVCTSNATICMLGKVVCHVPKKVPTQYVERNYINLLLHKRCLRQLEIHNLVLFLVVLERS